MRRALFALPFLLLACPSNPPDRNDGGSDGGGDGTERADAGDSGTLNGDDQCSVEQQDCDAGSCLVTLLPDGGQAARCLAGQCDLVAQNCDGGLKCAYASADGGTTSERRCVPDGTVGEGQSCNATVTSDNCMRGLTCVAQQLPDGGVSGLCSRFCYSSSGCTAPKLCYVRLTVPGTPEKPLICADPPPGCDPLAQNCQDSTFGCYPVGDGGACFRAGTKGDAEPCNSANDCQKAMTCVVEQQGPARCRSLCYWPADAGGGPSCGGGLSCIKLASQEHVGVCR